MTMIGFLARRAAGAMVLVFAVTSGALLLAQLAPGDYASQFGQNAGQIAAERHRLGLDLPIGRQYARFSIVPGNDLTRMSSCAMPASA